MMVDNPRETLVSIVIPVLNGEKDIGRCLRSIRDLDWPADDREVIVMDNGSSDGTLEVIRQLGFEAIVQSGGSVGALRNRGVAMSRGRYIGFVDADVELEPCWLREGMLSFADDSVVAAGCFPRIPGRATWVQKAWDLQQRDPWHLKIRPIAWLPSMNLLVRRDIFLAVGGFDELLETAEDVDLCYRMAEIGKMVMNNPLMDAVHWGEAPDLATFWRKEVWRGTSNLRGMSRHGFRLDELPSVAYPLYIILWLCIFGIGIWRGGFPLASVTLTFLSLPALVLACRTGFRTARIDAVLPLFVLYLVYGFARAYSMVRAPLRGASILRWVRQYVT